MLFFSKKFYKNIGAQLCHAIVFSGCFFVLASQSPLLDVVNNNKKKFMFLVGLRYSIPFFRNFFYCKKFASLNCHELLSEMNQRKDAFLEDTQLNLLAERLIKTTPIDRYDYVLKLFKVLDFDKAKKLRILFDEKNTIKGISDTCFKYAARESFDSIMRSMIENNSAPVDCSLLAKCFLFDKEHMEENIYKMHEAMKHFKSDHLCPHELHPIEKKMIELIHFNLCKNKNEMVYTEEDIFDLLLIIFTNKLNSVDEKFIQDTFIALLKFLSTKQDLMNQQLRRMTKFIEGCHKDIWNCLRRSILKIKSMQLRKKLSTIISLIRKENRIFNDLFSESVRLVTE